MAKDETKVSGSVVPAAGSASENEADTSEFTGVRGRVLTPVAARFEEICTSKKNIDRAVMLEIALILLDEAYKANKLGSYYEAAMKKRFTNMF